VAQEGWVDVRWVGGPYDGSEQPLPAIYRTAACVDMPDPATAEGDGASEPAIFTGPMHRYALAPDGDGLLATHAP
jgi:hypothetical protein